MCRPGPQALDRPVMSPVETAVELPGHIRIQDKAVALLQPRRQSQRWAGISAAGLARTSATHVVEVAEPAAVFPGGLPRVVEPRGFVREFRPFRRRRQAEFGSIVEVVLD